MSDIQMQKQQLRDDLRRLLADTRRLLETTGDVADKSAANARQQLEETLSSVESRILDEVEQLQRSAHEKLDAADRAIRENPYTSLAIAAGSGLFLGLLMKRD